MSVPLSCTSYFLSSKLSSVFFCHQNSLLVFGGRVSENVVNELWSFDIETRQWTLISLPRDSDEPIAVAGHTATLVGSKMIVLFGYGTTKGFTNKVQEFDLGNASSLVLLSATSNKDLCHDTAALLKFDQTHK